MFKSVSPNRGSRELKGGHKFCGRNWGHSHIETLSHAPFGCFIAYLKISEIGQKPKIQTIFTGLKNKGRVRLTIFKCESRYPHFYPQHSLGSPRTPIGGYTLEIFFDLCYYIVSKLIQSIIQKL